MARSAPAAAAYVESITLPTDVVLYGGFAGTETDRSQRDWTANVTVLDGNKSTVVTSSVKGAVVDGFAVRNGTYGIYANGTATITNCAISGSTTGIGAFGGTANISNCTVSGNSTGISIGGGTANVTSSSIGGNGTGIRVYYGITNVTSCSISGNGAGIYEDGGTTNVTNCSISGNGTGIDGNITGNPSWGTVSISNCTISGNTGDGVYLEGGTATVTNCAISGNITGIRVFRNGMMTSMTVTNCTVSRNSSIGVSVVGGTANVVNSVVAFNPTGIYGGGGTATFSYTDVYGSSPDDFRNIPDPTGANGNISQDPRFVSRTGGNYHLISSSPCIDVGDDSVIGAGQRDLDRRLRIIGAHVDMGAFESGIIGAYTLSDAGSALATMGGLANVPSDFAHLNVDRGGASAGTIDMYDVVWIVRRAMGLDPS